MSVFTFDPEPRPVSSPWLRSKKSSIKPDPEGRTTGLLTDYGVTKLEAEPQEGPVEYKLHLLLRSRRRYEYMSTVARIPGSVQGRPASDPKSSKVGLPQGVVVARRESRQYRLEKLTTQLLWRLQQSCPYHDSSATMKLVIPQLPDDGLILDEPPRLGKLPPGLESSRGALYEIGVADDGTLVGLTKDEMDESLETLRIMATSLGCEMEVLRTVDVGDCAWLEPRLMPKSTSQGTLQKARLCVAEAIVSPDMRPRSALQGIGPAEGMALSDQGPLTADQLRVTLAGPTLSGKSTLLGSLSSGVLDDGRGKSRSKLLRHPHEHRSGLTSSIAQELVGYRRNSIVNYAQQGIESWINIHDSTRDGRLVYLLDSAGHPRFRRTILRGIVGWAPHWIFLCVPALGGDTGPEADRCPAEVSRSPATGTDLVLAHLDLCLQLGLPLVVVMTKMDLAERVHVKSTLGSILSATKRVGRTPRILPEQATQSKLSYISQADREGAGRVVADIHSSRDRCEIVPIVFTSAVKGTGIGLLHALLQALPTPVMPTSRDFIGKALKPEQPSSLFHIEDRFSLPASHRVAASNEYQGTDVGTVVAGHLRFGALSIGDSVVVGPFPVENGESGSVLASEPLTASSYGSALSRPSPAEIGRNASRKAGSASAIKCEWHRARIVSIRNLRFPVQTLTAGQAGSVGMIFDLVKQEGMDRIDELRAPSTPRIRKGMVLAVPSRHMMSAGLHLQAASGLTVIFQGENAAPLHVGKLVDMYAASVRATARIVCVSRSNRDVSGHDAANEVERNVLNYTKEGDEDGQVMKVPQKGFEVQFEFLSNREWIELGSRILLLVHEGGPKEKSGLEGFVGTVAEIVE